jgi:hypothetical protein
MHHGSAVLTVHGGKTICRRVLGSRGGGRADEGGGFEMRSAVPIAAPTGLDRERPAEAAPLCGRLLRSAESNRYSPCEPRTRRLRAEAMLQRTSPQATSIGLR